MSVLNSLPNTPASITTTDKDSITLLRHMRSFAEDRWEEFQESQLDQDLTTEQKATLLGNLANPGICGIVATGAD